MSKCAALCMYTLKLGYNSDHYRADAVIGQLCLGSQIFHSFMTDS